MVSCFINTKLFSAFSHQPEILTNAKTPNIMPFMVSNAIGIVLFQAVKFDYFSLKNAQKRSITCDCFNPAHVPQPFNVE